MYNMRPVPTPFLLNYRGTQLYNAAGFEQDRFDAASQQFKEEWDSILSSHYAKVVSTLLNLLGAGVLGLATSFAVLRVLDWILDAPRR
jgi:hypothetical protein